MLLGPQRVVLPHVLPEDERTRPRPLIRLLGRRVWRAANRNGGDAWRVCSLPQPGEVPRYLWPVSPQSPPISMMSRMRHGIEEEFAPHASSCWTGFRWALEHGEVLPIAYAVVLCALFPSSPSSQTGQAWPWVQVQVWPLESQDLEQPV